MLSNQLLTSLTAFAAAASAFPITEESNILERQTIGAACKDVHTFIAKGWNEPYPGRQGALAGSICYGLNSCDYEDIQWDNVNQGYCAAVTQGKRNGLQQIKTYAKRCPNSKLVLTGYSEGADVIGGILGGGKGRFGDQQCLIEYTEALTPTTSPGNKIGAATLFGDPRHVADQSYNVLAGASISSGNPRGPRMLARMNKFASVLRSYCHDTDSVCAGAGAGPFVEDDHLNYFDQYTDDAGGWVKSILGY